MSRRVLFSVLDWGLGHATRSIPVINALRERDCEVILASDGKALQLLQGEFPNLSTYELRGYNVEYSSQRLLLNVVKNSRRIFRAMQAEHDQITEIARQESITHSITDNRYGCNVQGIPNAIITHQLQFRTGKGMFDTIAMTRVKRWLKPFDYIWIPDDPMHTLSGELSATDHKRKRYIGWLSTIKPFRGARQYDLAVILSGPEPQRTILEGHVREQLAKLNLTSVLVRGLPGNEESRIEDGIIVYDFADRKKINDLIAHSAVVLCRSGYSSLMDLQCIGKRAILTPTPGQPEQVYLAERMARLQQYIVQDQDHLDIPAGLAKLQQREAPMPDPQNRRLLWDALGEFMG